MMKHGEEKTSGPEAYQGEQAVLKPIPEPTCRGFNNATGSFFQCVSHQKIKRKVRQIHHECDRQQSNGGCHRTGDTTRPPFRTEGESPDKCKIGTDRCDP